VVSKGIEAYRTSCGGALLMITHNTRILERLSVDRTHVMVRVAWSEGPAELIDDIDRTASSALRVMPSEQGAHTGRRSTAPSTTSPSPRRDTSATRTA